MFRITRDPSSGSSIQCLVKITQMVLSCASLDCAVHTQCLSRLCSTHTVPLYTVQYTHSTSLHCAVHTQYLPTLYSTHKHYRSKYAATTPTTST